MSINTKEKVTIKEVALDSEPFQFYAESHSVFIRININKTYQKSVSRRK